LRKTARQKSVKIFDAVVKRFLKRLGSTEDSVIDKLEAALRSCVSVLVVDDDPGVLSLQFQEGVSARALNLDGTETYDFVGPDAQLKAHQDLTLRITRKNDQVENVPVGYRIDTPIEIDYYQNGGILPYVLRQLAIKA
jgi:hypothetical protein